MIHADLGPELEAIVLDLIESGRYSSRMQVLRESEELRAWRDAQLTEFEDSFTESVEEAANGQGQGVEEVLLPLIAKYNAQAISGK
ncbi:type II toxin-antitoxin system ParD family antitoxin [Roseateles sp. MS654]|uniref:type II toxin-antitoxin system ParD family antitoxin n=1 Tax=Roseateles sp. MS654 TaxID=3412685 RepID=UPI003C2B96E0